MSKYEWEKFGGVETAINTENGERLYMGGACIELNRLTARVAELEEENEKCRAFVAAFDEWEEKEKYCLLSSSGAALSVLEAREALRGNDDG